MGEQYILCLEGGLKFPKQARKSEDGLRSTLADFSWFESAPANGKNEEFLYEAAKNFELCIKNSK